MSKASWVSRRWVRMIGIFLVPLILVGAVVGTVWRATDRTDTVRAAIVNLDEPVTIGEQYVPLGRQLAGKLSSLTSVPASGGEQAANYAWSVTNAEDAAAGLANGTYAAVVTIPKNFSAAATSTAGDANAVEQAVVDVQISPRASAVDPTLARTVVSAAISSLNTDLTKTYLDNVFVGFSTMGEQFTTISDASRQLADGTSQVRDGVAQSTTGAEKLATGLEQLSAGSAQLNSGVSQYTAGVTSLSEGLARLNAGVSVLPQQVNQLATGAEQSAAGAEKLASGAKELSGGFPQYQAGLEKTGSGASQVATGANGVSQGLAQYQQAMAGLSTQLTCEAVGLPEGEACEGFKQGVAAASQQAAQGLGSTSDTKSLMGAASATAAGASAVAAGINGTQAQPGLVQGAQQLATGSKQVSDGAQQLATGSRQLATGTRQLANGLPQVASGVSQANSGARQLAANGGPLVTGVRQYTDGVGQTATGARALAGGLSQLRTGATTLDAGAGELADGLAKGATTVPTYTQSERERLSTVVTTPVTTGKDSGPVAFADPATLSAVLGIALWAGALLGAALLGTGARQAWRSSRSSLVLMLKGMAPVAAIGVVQGIGFGALAGWLTGSSSTETVQLVGVSALAGLAFVAVNQALVAIGGGIGRFAAIVVGVLAFATSVVSALPAVLANLRPLLPTTSVMDGLTAIVGPTPGLGAAAVTLGAWLVVGLIGTWWGVARHRQIKPQL